MQADDLMRRHEALAAKRANWESLWEKVTALVLPRIGEFHNKRSPGQNQSAQQYDAFPMLALEKFAAMLEAGSMPRSALWHKLSSGDEELDKNHDAKIYLEAFNTMLWDERYAPKANFASQAHEKRISLGSVGTGVIMVEPRGVDGIKYRTCHMSECYIASNADGLIDTVHRRFELSARQAVQFFREKAPDKVHQAIQAGKLWDTFEFVHCVGPTEDYDTKRLDVLPFTGSYLFPAGREIVMEQGYHEQPYIVTRYSVSPREDYGRSPAIQLLPDIQMLNEMKMTMIEVANLALDPPVLAHENISEFDLSAGTINTGMLDDNGRPLAVPWPSSSQPGIARELMLDVRNNIDDAMGGIYFRVLLENPQMTATQAMLLAQQQGQLSAPMVGRIHNEWAGPMIARESGILYRQGKHPPMPEVMKQRLARTGKPLQVEYVSPLTRAVRSEEAIGIMRAFETMAPLAQVEPKIYHMFDILEVGRLVADVNGVPAKVMKSPDRLAAEDAADMEQQQLASVLTAAPIAAQTAKTMAEANRLAQAVPQQ